MLRNGFPQGPNGLIVPNGSVSFLLNVDATIIASPFGFVSADIPVVFQFDAAGALISPATLYSNSELNPQNSQGLGTYYLVTFYDQNGARLNLRPMWWQFPEPAGTTVDIGQMAPFATVGGNVIFYPTVFPTLTLSGPAPSVAPGQLSLGNLTGVGNGAPILLTIPAQGSGSGPVNANVVVGLIQWNLGGTPIWIPYLT